MRPFTSFADKILRASPFPTFLAWDKKLHFFFSSGISPGPMHVKHSTNLLCLIETNMSLLFGWDKNLQFWSYWYRVQYMPNAVQSVLFNLNFFFFDKLQGREEKELPEYILGTVRLNKVKLDTAVPLEGWHKKKWWLWCVYEFTTLLWPIYIDYWAPPICK